MGALAGKGVVGQRCWVLPRGCLRNSTAYVYIPEHIISHHAASWSPPLPTFLFSSSTRGYTTGTQDGKMNNTLPPSLVHHHTQQSTVSEADFLARVSAFERNEEAEARRAKDAMRRMVSDQTRPPRHDNRGNGPRGRRDRSPSTGPAGGIFRDFQYHFAGAIPTGSQPPPHPVAGFHIYGHHATTASSVYPFFEIQTGGPPPLQDAYHDALVLVSAPYLAVPFASHPARLSDPAPFPGGAGPAPFMVVPHPSSYYPHPDLTRDTHDRGRGRARRSYSPDRNDSRKLHLHAPEIPDHRANTAWQYTNVPVNPHGHRMTPAPPAPPPRPSSTLAPPTSPASLALHRSAPSSKNVITAQTEVNQRQKRETSFRIDYDLRTHPASLRVSPASSAVLSQPARVPKEEQVNSRLNPSRA